jgi:predicted transcriptional regulator
MPTIFQARRVLTLEEVGRLVGAQVYLGKDLSVPVTEYGASDLMSDVLALSKPGMLLLTGLASPQVIRTAVISDLCGVVLVRGKRPGKEILKLAAEANMPVLGTELTMFEAAGVLYSAVCSDK